MRHRTLAMQLAWFWLVCSASLAVLSAALAAAPRLYDNFVLDVANDRVSDVKALLARGMDPNTVDLNGDPVLLVAARAGYRDTVDALLAARAAVERRNRFGDTALMVAALNGHLEVARTLRQHGAAVDMPGWTPLIYAATGGRDDMVRYLLGEGAKINAASPNGTTALMMAVREAHPAIVDLLLTRGADVNARNEIGATALAWAERNEDREMVARLRRAGAR